MAIATAFYPSISYGSAPTVINFGASDVREVASLLEINEAAIRKQNISEDGTSETLFLRFEVQTRLSFQFITKATADLLRTWWRSHAALGNQSALTLDRLGTCAGQLEFDSYNTFFSLAELVDAQWQPRRTTPRGLHYAMTLTFRQGAVTIAGVPSAGVEQLDRYDDWRLFTGMGLRPPSVLVLHDAGESRF
jgi:hypothetical protein